MDASVACPVCDGEPRVLVAIRHPMMLRFTRQLLERECGCWVAAVAQTSASLTNALDDLSPDLLIIDAADFPGCCPAVLDHIDRARVLVIGPELDDAYRSAAMAGGAGGWLAREQVAGELGREMRRMLGCVHDPCPTDRPPAPKAASLSSSADG